MSTKKKPTTAHSSQATTPRDNNSIKRSQPQQTHTATAAAAVLSTPVALLSSTGVPMMNPYGFGVGSVSAASLCWHNLLLLGFNPQAQSAQHKMELSASMFDRPNARAMHLLLHFLLMAIKGCPAADAHNAAPEWKDMIQVFSHSYPCLDRNQARDFLAVCVGVLLGFEKGPAGVFPAGTIRKSHFAAPQGERIYNIFWHLSSYALHQTLMRDYPLYPVPALQLPPLSDPHVLFPHLIKAAKMHIVRQSQLYITKLGRMQSAEEMWRAQAEEINEEYNRIQAELAKYNPVQPMRIPGQPVVSDTDQQLFSAPAHAERMRKLDIVKTLHAQLNDLYTATDQQRTTLDLILNGTWQPQSLSRLQLEKILNPTAASSSSAGSATAPSAASKASPLNFHSIVTQWNQSLSQMHATLTSYLAPPPSASAVIGSAPASATPSYVAALTAASAGMDKHWKDHEVKLANLRALSNHLRTTLIPELEHDLAQLQTNLSRAGKYTGPISTPSAARSRYESRDAAAPGLIPPTPFHSNHSSTSLAVPSTPAIRIGGLVQFTPSAHAAARAQQSSKGVADSVRKAAASKAQRGEWQPQIQQHQQQQQSSLSTIVDEEHWASPAAAGSSTALTSPAAASLSGSNDHDNDSSPQFPKKLVFSPESGTASNASTPPQHAASASSARAVPLSAGSSISTGSARSSLSPAFVRQQLQAQQQQHSARRAKFVSPPPPAPHSASRATPHSSHAPHNRSGASTFSSRHSLGSNRSFRSPTSTTEDFDEGLLGQEEVSKWHPHTQQTLEHWG